MKGLRETTATLAVVTSLPGFFINDDNVELIRTGFLSRRFLSIIKSTLYELKDSYYLQHQKPPPLPILLRYLDTFNLSYVVLIQNSSPFAASVLGPFFYEEKFNQSLVESLSTLSNSGFTIEIAQKAVDKMEVKDFPFVQACGQLILNLLGCPTKQPIKIDTVKKHIEPSQATPPLYGHRTRELEISTNYQFERELKQLIALGNRAGLRKLLVPKNQQELELAKLNSVYMTRKSVSSFRTTKNLLISLNTIFRQAVENSGLTPLYVHTISEDIVTNIEQVNSDETSLKVVNLMIDNYCNAINNASMQNRSYNIVKVQRYIINHIDEKLTLDKLSEIANLEASYLCRLFKRECNRTITQYIQNLRINEAKWLLESSNKPLMEIAQILGFQEQSYFSFVFKRYTGMSPTLYRHTYRKDENLN